MHLLARSGRQHGGVENKIRLQSPQVSHFDQNPASPAQLHRNKLKEVE